MTGTWVTAAEAAEVLAVSRRELYRLIDAGEVPARLRGSTLEVLVDRPRLRLVT